MAEAQTLVFLAGKRTPFGSYGGSLKDVNPTDLAVTAGKAALEQAQVSPEEIDHTIFGNVIHSAPDAVYSPRHIGLKLGIPQDRPALGINRLCGTGFQVIIEAYQQMLAGDTRLALVGGSENMSMSPYVLRGTRWGLKMGNSQVIDVMMESLHDTFTNTPMAITAENLAVKYQITRQDSDEFSLRSQKLFAQALAAGHFKEELTPYVTVDKKGNAVSLDKDEHPKPETTAEVLAKLKPVFKKDGLVTAASASGIVDGAAALVVATESEARRRGARPLARLVSYGIVGCDPSIMGIGPAPAARKALQRAGLKLEQMDLIEVNEAFSAQAVAVERELKLDRNQYNLDGGAIAVGHPLAASGARITQHMIYALRRNKKRYGLVSACIGGGQGIALVIEAL